MKTNQAKTRLKRGPATTMAMRARGGLWAKERAFSSAVSPGMPSTAAGTSTVNFNGQLIDGTGTPPLASFSARDGTALAPLLAVPLVILVGLSMQRQFQQVVNEAYREGNQKNALLIEVIHGLEAIKTSMAEGQVQKRWEEVVGLNARSTGRVKALANFSMTFSQSASQLVGLVIIVGGVYLISTGSLTLGGLIACNILVGRAMAPLGAVAGMLVGFGLTIFYMVGSRFYGVSWFGTNTDITAQREAEDEGRERKRRRGAGPRPRA